MRMEVISNGRLVPKDQQHAFMVGVSERMNARTLQGRVERAKRRHEGSPERQSVAIAMLAVEEQIVKALWTIARQPLGRISPMPSGRCGVDYIHDRSDVFSIYVDAKGGKWDMVAPRPALPSAKDISQANLAQDWLLLIDDEGLRRLLVAGATSKRGDAGRGVNWMRVRQSLRELGGLSVRTLKWRYSEALRIIVSELTLARVA